MKNIIKVSLVTCLLVAMSGCAEKELKTKELQVKRSVSTYVPINLNKNGKIGLGDEEGKLILPTCPKKIFAGGHSYGDKSNNIFDAITEHYKTSENGDIFKPDKDFFSKVNIENREIYNSYVIYNTACVSEKGKNKSVEVFSEYIDMNLVEK